MQVHALMHIRIHMHTKVACGERTISGEGKEQFHAERVVGPQNRAELQLSTLGRSGTSRPKNQPVGSTSPTHSDRLSLSYPRGDHPLLSNLPPKYIPPRVHSRLSPVSSRCCSKTCEIRGISSF